MTVEQNFKFVSSVLLCIYTAWNNWHDMTHYISTRNNFLYRRVIYHNVLPCTDASGVEQRPALNNAKKLLLIGFCSIPCKYEKLTPLHPVILHSMSPLHVVDRVTWCSPVCMEWSRFLLSLFLLVLYVFLYNWLMDKCYRCNGPRSWELNKPLLLGAWHNSWINWSLWPEKKSNDRDFMNGTRTLLPFSYSSVLM